MPTFVIDNCVFSGAYAGERAGIYMAQLHGDTVREAELTAMFETQKQADTLNRLQAQPWHTYAQTFDAGQQKSAPKRSSNLKMMQNMFPKRASELTKE